MSKKLRVLVVAAATVLGLGFGASAFAQLPNLPAMGTTGTGGLTAPAVGSLGDTSHGPCVEQLLNLPALNSCRDANGKVISDRVFPFFLTTKIPAGLAGIFMAALMSAAMSTMSSIEDGTRSSIIS